MGIMLATILNSSEMKGGQIDNERGREREGRGMVYQPTKRVWMHLILSLKRRVASRCFLELFGGYWVPLLYIKEDITFITMTSLSSCSLRTRNYSLCVCICVLCMSALLYLLCMCECSVFVCRVHACECSVLNRHETVTCTVV